MKQEIPTATPEMQPAGQPVSFNLVEHHCQPERWSQRTGSTTTANATATTPTPDSLANSRHQPSLVQISHKPHAGDLFIMQEDDNDEVYS